jgi:DNA-binding NtrC family response regulator
VTREEMMNILIVDDEERIVDLIRKFLEQKGHAVDVAFDGKAALELIKGKSIDIAFLDEDMPELTGLEIAKYIKQNNLTVKSIILTGYPHLDEEFSKIVGADEYLAKPVDLDKIEEIVNKYKT